MPTVLPALEKAISELEGLPVTELRVSLNDPEAQEKLLELCGRIQAVTKIASGD